MIQVPNRVAWHVDLTVPVEQSWSKAVLKSVRQAKYASLRANWLQGSEIGRLFTPTYKRLIMSRDDYRLDPEQTILKLEKMESDKAYKLFWVQTESGEDLGGIVVKLALPIALIAYRAFDHELAEASGYEALDLYVEYRLRGELERGGVVELSHGNDRHPLVQLGLSGFKLRVGARPFVSEKGEEVEIDPKGYLGYYTRPVGGRYTAFQWLAKSGEEVETQFEKLASRAGLSLLEPNDEIL